MKDEEYLAHIEAAIIEIKTRTGGMTQEAYEAESRTQRAVERNLQIIGDAEWTFRRLGLADSHRGPAPAASLFSKRKASRTARAIRSASIAGAP